MWGELGIVHSVRVAPFCSCVFSPWAALPAFGVVSSPPQAANVSAIAAAASASLFGMESLSLLQLDKNGFGTARTDAAGGGREWDG